MLIFSWPRNFGIPEHNILHALIVLIIDLLAHNRRATVFGFTSNVSENWRSDLLTLGCFTGTYGLDDIGLLPLNHSGVDTMKDSIISLYCCLSSHLSANFYNTLMISRHICSYKSLLLNDLYPPIITICYFSCSDCNNLYELHIDAQMNQC